MRQNLASFVIAAVIFALPISCMAASAHQQGFQGKKGKFINVQVGPRPYYLVEAMEDGPLKKTLQHCSEKPLKKTDFSIGHRGAALQFPEHTKQSYEAGARMGAGILECDVTFTSEGDLVCRHAQCDLHTTTNILGTPLAEKCRCPLHPQNSIP
jgi:glycerophosphoryl diester phosphodiesterase